MANTYSNLRFFDSDSNDLNLVFNTDLDLWQGVVYLPLVSTGLYETFTLHILENVEGQLLEDLHVTPIAEAVGDVSFKFRFSNDYNTSEDIFLYSAKSNAGEILVQKDLEQSATLLDNSMVMDTDLNKYAKKNSGDSVKKIDYILTTSEQDLQNIIANMTDKNKFHVIGSPRYCKDWLKIKSKFKIDGNDVSLNKKYKVKILFLIPKNFINIFTDELIRTIDFISSYQEIELILLKNNFSYPKIPSFIAKRSNIRHYYVSVEYSTSKLIEWADIVFHAGTGVIFESFMKEKVTVLPRYLTCNTLISDKYNAGLNLRNRDELRNLCNAAVISLENLKKEYKKKSNSSNKKFINKCVNGNLNSVPKMIQKSLLSIVRKF